MKKWLTGSDDYFREITRCQATPARWSLLERKSKGGEAKNTFLGPDFEPKGCKSDNIDQNCWLAHLLKGGLNPCISNGSPLNQNDFTHRCTVIKALNWKESYPSPRRLLNTEGSFWLIQPELRWVHRATRVSPDYMGSTRLPGFHPTTKFAPDY